MNYAAIPIKDGIIRISRYENMPQNHLERYGLIKIPEKEPVSRVAIAEHAITLPNGKRLEFCIREDNAFWSDEENYLLEKFKDKIPTSRIQGRPDEVLPPKYEVLEGRTSPEKFGISFKIDADEKFYGLGEGSRDRIQLRGESYQNWAIYQFDELVIPLVYSNKNWGILIGVQDRHFVDIDDHAKDQLTVLGNFDELDVFVFYGDSMKELIKLYTDISGKSMLLPKWAYGLTYGAHIHQNQFEIMNDMMKFREKGIPCDNVSLEPGWMEKHYDYSFDKKWDLKKFHIEEWMHSRDYQGSFLAALRRFGFHVALWLCIDYDFCDQEERLVTGEGKLPSWYDHLEQFVNDGADGFKLDPADMLMRIDPNKIYTNGKSELEMHNVSQVLVPKQVHEGFAGQMKARPFLHYCGGYTGQQRWGAAWTGDNGGLEGSMIWIQNLAMSGFSNSTVDMDVFSVEAIHFAMLAPWAQHNAWSGCRQPWYAGPENEQAYTYYARLRYSMIPYLYSAAVECHETGVPMVRPMALEHQGDEKCAELCRQYMLGSFILISAFTKSVYLPEGRWIDFWTGEEYEGNSTIENYVPPKGRGGAFFIRKGAIIPKWRDRDYTSQYGEEEIELHFYPCGRSEYVFREDDGVSLDYLNHQACHTKIICDAAGDIIKIDIGERCGDYQGKPERRIWKVIVHGTDKPVEVICGENEAQVEINMLCGLEEGGQQ